jgi:RNA ligase
MITFEPFPKLARLYREVTITEKIDGTNAQVIITEDGEIEAASRSRIITPQDDNYGFAAWVDKNKAELLTLGVGRHFGEWWGKGIQRAYSKPERCFSLFNTGRWNKENIPPCCGVVPVLYSGTYKPSCIPEALRLLRNEGSLAAPGFMSPEGVVMWHDHARAYFKVTLDNDEMSKGEAAARLNAVPVKSLKPKPVYTAADILGAG